MPDEELWKLCAICGNNRRDELHKPDAVTSGDLWRIQEHRFIPAGKKPE